MPLPTNLFHRFSRRETELVFIPEQVRPENVLRRRAKWNNPWSVVVFGLVRVGCKNPDVAGAVDIVRPHNTNFAWAHSRCELQADHSGNDGWQEWNGRVDQYRIDRRYPLRFGCFGSALAESFNRFDVVPGVRLYFFVFNSQAECAQHVDQVSIDGVPAQFPLHVPIPECLECNRPEFDGNGLAVNCPEFLQYPLGRGVFAGRFAVLSVVPVALAGIVDAKFCHRHRGGFTWHGSAGGHPFTDEPVVFPLRCRGPVRTQVNLLPIE